MDRNGHVAVITGGASGIGCGLAKVALERGMRVVLADRDGERLDSFAATLTGDVLVCPVDVTDAAAVEMLAKRSFDMFGQVDLLFNNAGVLVGGKSWEIPVERWNWVIQVNVMGVVHGVASFLPRMIAGGRTGHIVNTASIGGLLASPLLAPYSASKFAVVSMTEALAVELQLENARISAALLAPGPVRSNIFHETEQMDNDSVSGQAVKRMRDFTWGEGISAEELARRTFAGLDANQFWLIPQREIFEAAYPDRVEKLLAGVNPIPATYNL